MIGNLVLAERAPTSPMAASIPPRQLVIQSAPFCHSPNHIPPARSASRIVPCLLDGSGLRKEAGGPYCAARSAGSDPSKPAVLRRNWCSRVTPIARGRSRRSRPSGKGSGTFVTVVHPPPAPVASSSGWSRRDERRLCCERMAGVLRGAFGSGDLAAQAARVRAGRRCPASVDCAHEPALHGPSGARDHRADAP